ncbi:hypothetical protein DW1_2443 [Proteiniborus sp. DW1]|uniref:folate family ECF transporter S component n=1 Tax=Proteiniborus sp. DW1 TaxID=1889883 RepID=UPI00092E1E2D|nr:folate family ECF transporter S component [Proteiniborus sp. DW1]SCG84007.1 hypothetical protein DW1_2443 [Proteiniborus sp. DW1]
MKKINTSTIVISGFLIALNVVLSRIITIPGIINFGGFPIIFGGIVLGPIVGGIVGAVGDVVSFIVRPTGTFMPHFVLTSALTGVIPGLLVKVLKNDTANPKLWKIFISILVGQVITSVLLVPYFRQVLFGHPFIATMLNAARKQAVNVPLYSIILKILVQSLHKAGALRTSHRC